MYFRPKGWGKFNPLPPTVQPVGHYGTTKGRTFEKLHEYKHVIYVLIDQTLVILVNIVIFKKTTLSHNDSQQSMQIKPYEYGVSPL